jgi:hypothetical protein
VVLKVSVAQRRARLVERHRLSVASQVASQVTGPVTVAGAAQDMIALHATDPWTVYLSAHARVPAATVEDMDAAIYAERTLVRVLGMRRTMWLVPAGLWPVVQRGCTDEVAKRLRKQLVKDLADGGVGDGDAAGWLRDVEAGVLGVLAGRGSAAGAELSNDEPRLRTQLTYAQDKSYGGTQNITSRVLMLMSAEGQIIRGHRRGGVSSGQFTWHLPDAWLAEAGDTAREARDSLEALDADTARVELARRWLLSFGPAPVADLQWWAGWTGGQTKAALAALPVREADLDGVAGVTLAADDDFPAAVPPAVALLPALDPTPMGWQNRSWFLDPHGPVLFDRTGNIGPTVWWNGRIAGGWAQRASGEVVWRLLDDIGSDATAAVAAAAAGLETWLGPGRVTPRFRTPLERELSA